MGLVIHDLTQEQWENVSGGYTGWTVVSDTGVFRPGENLSDLSSETGITADTGTIRPCIGCFESTRMFSSISPPKKTGVCLL